jgi:hypothetical protein
MDLDGLGGKRERPADAAFHGQQTGRDRHNRHGRHGRHGIHDGDRGYAWAIGWWLADAGCWVLGAAWWWWWWWWSWS